MALVSFLVGFHHPRIEKVAFTDFSGSDIDDTIKISDVLDKPKLIQNTLFNDPTPVSGMPDLYKSLASSLDSPQFMYVSGSPFQLYPFLHDFINSTYPQGPLLLRNLSFTDISSILDFANPNGVLEYKLSQIDTIHGIYPGKTWLTIGDSGEKDPETYGAA